MKRYERPEMELELFVTEDIYTDSTVISTKAKIAVPLGKEDTLSVLQS